MKIEKVAIASLVFDPTNSRKHSTRNLDAIKGSLTKFGQQPIRFFSRVTSVSGDCWNFKDIQAHGYGKFHSNGVTWRAHRWIMWAIGKITTDDKRCVLHTCDNRACVNPAHLYLGDRYQNAQDIKNRHRTHLIRDPKLGQRNPSAKLTNSQVLEIRKKLNHGYLGKDIALDYGVSKTTISEIKNRKVWGHL